MPNSDYWKDAYKESWPKSKKREKVIAELIFNKTGKKVVLKGFGAGSDEFISGSAKDHGYEKGDADGTVEQTNIKIEVTGPNVTVSDTAPLWVRPDKIANAKRHPEYDTWVVHCIDKAGTVRTIHLDADFFQKYDNSEYIIIHPIIRGRNETYVSIPYDDANVLPFDKLVKKIENY